MKYDIFKIFDDMVKEEKAKQTEILKNQPAAKQESDPEPKLDPEPDPKLDPDPDPE